MSQHIAVFDPEAFYPFRNLVEGQLTDWNDLEAIERFIRAIVLHDEMCMVLSPTPYDPIAEKELKRDYPYQRNRIVALGPIVNNYEGLISEQRDLKPTTFPDPSSTLCNVASEYSNAGLEIFTMMLIFSF